MTRPNPPMPPPESDKQVSGTELVRYILSIFAPITVLSALLYYFGFIRERAFWAYFGVDLGSVGFESTDYIVRSPGTLFVPLVFLVGLALLGILIHHVFAPWVKRGSRRLKALSATTLGLLAIILLLGGILSFSGEFLHVPVLSPLLLGVGAGLLEYTILTIRSTRLTSGRIRRSIGHTPTQYARRVLVGCLILAALFAATADLAHDRGVKNAETFANSLPIQTQVILYTKLRLQISGTGVEAISLDPTNAAYEYRYNGLRLLLHMDDRWLLIPSGWTTTSGDTVIIVRESESNVRIELAR